MADDLYDRDFFLWTREQAQALRARQAGGEADDPLEREYPTGAAQALQ